MKRIAFALFPLLAAGLFSGNVLAGTRHDKETDENGIRNVIVMIPDGCCTELLALGRWLNGGLPLALDKHVRGLVRTYCSDSPIGDSAPTGSAYATGHRSQDGFVATYPAMSMDKEGRRFPTDSAEAYRPMFTLLEAARVQGKATGMVVPCHFPHATPADFLAHTPKRNQYARIAKQMIHHPCDLLLGGGAYWVDSSMKNGYCARKELERHGISYFKDFKATADAVEKGLTKAWGLFAPKEMDYEIDRDPEQQPSLEDMTRLALKALSRQENGFFLMVEGSKVDWGAHDNDLPAALFDFLAFDKAVAAAMEFARKDGHTLVMVMPDHQTGGLSIGNRRLDSGYATAGAAQLFDGLRNSKASYEKTVKDLFNDNEELSIARITGSLKRIVKENFGIEDMEEKDLARLARTLQENKSGRKSVRAFAEMMNRHSYMGWTTFGHNGGDVFLAAYHPMGEEPSGVVDNEQIAPYICRQAGLGNLDSLSLTYYAPLKQVFPDAGCRIVYGKNLFATEADDPRFIELELKDGKKLKIYPNTDHAELDKKKKTLPGICIYNGKGFYLPAACAGISGQDTTKRK